MSSRYAPLPNDPRANQDAQYEMEAAFDDSDDEHISESHPLARTTTPPTPARVPGSYDFENVDYANYPPPGSPPAPSAFALPNNFGNSNGQIPSFEPDSLRAPPPRTLASRVLSMVFPSRYGGYTQVAHTGVIGGGTRNDGVFANVTAKPSRPVTIQEGDETFIVPEDARTDAPPSYSSAQADAVPPYWETTVHAPFSPDSIGEMIIDSLPTGSLFSFLWNMLVSISFQFVGFLLTYLLHTTHAARLGSRAGLGITLIQYGFALRAKLDGGGMGEENPWDETWAGNDKPNFPTAAEASSNDFYKSYNISFSNSTLPSLTQEQASIIVADATTEYLSFFLMTIGWFILLTSLLGFWRVKRWERNIVNSQQPGASDSPRTARSTFERAFGLHGITTTGFFRQGFGLSARQEDVEAQAEVNSNEDVDEHTVMLNISPDDPNRARLVADALERRLQSDLRDAGLL